MPLEFDQPASRPTRSTLVFDEPTPPAPARSPAPSPAPAPAPAPSSAPAEPARQPLMTSRARRAVESAQQMTDMLFSRPAARGAVTGGAAGAMLPELTAMTGMGMQLFPYTRPAGAALMRAAPSLGSLRAPSAALGAVAGAAQEETEQAARNFGFSPAAAQLQGSLVGMGLGALPVTGLAGRAIRATERPYVPRTQTPEELRTAVTEAAEPAAQRLTAEEQRLRAEQLRREMATRGVARAPERQPQEPAAIETSARREAKLAAADTPTDFADGRNLDARIRTEMSSALQRAQQQQEEVGGAAFEEYARQARSVQEALPFGASPEGRELRAFLNSQIRGGRGQFRTVSGEERADLVRVRNELFGRPRSDVPTPAVAGQVSAAEQAEAAEAARKRPVDFSLVEREIRRLRNIAQRGEAFGFNRERQTEAAGIADRLEASLNAWLQRGGASARPREEYAKASEAKNRFLTQFGEAMTARQEVPFYRPGLPQGVTATAENRLSALMFRDRDTVRFSRELIGNKLVNEFAERFASNQLVGKNGAGVLEYLRNPANSYVYEVPGLYAKLTKYAQDLVRRELSSLQMAQVQKGLAAGIETSRAATSSRVQAIQKTQQELSAALAAFERASATDMAKAWRSSVRPRLERTNLFSSFELNNLEDAILRASTAANKAERKQELSSVIDGLIRDKIRTALRGSGLAGAAYAAYEFFDPFARRR